MKGDLHGFRRVGHGPNEYMIVVLPRSEDGSTKENTILPTGTAANHARNTSFWVWIHFNSIEMLTKDTQPDIQYYTAAYLISLFYTTSLQSHSSMWGSIHWKTTAVQSANHTLHVQIYSWGTGSPVYWTPQLMGTFMGKICHQEVLLAGQDKNLLKVRPNFSRIDYSTKIINCYCLWKKQVSHRFQTIWSK